MDPVDLDVSKPCHARTFLDRLHIANYGSRGEDENLQAMFRNHHDSQPDIPMLKTVDRSYSLRIEMDTMYQDLEPEEDEEWSDLYSILCPNSSSFQPYLDGDEHLNFLDCVDPNVNLSKGDRISSGSLPSIFLPLGPIIEEARSLNNRFEYRYITNFKLLWNLSTRPTSLWIMYDYYNPSNYDMWEWNKLNKTEYDQITLQEKRDVFHPDSMRQRKFRALDDESRSNENLSWFKARDAWDSHAEEVREAAAKEKTIKIDDYNQVNIVKPSQIFNHKSSSAGEPEDWDYLSRLSKSAFSTPMKYRPSNPSQTSFINPFVKPRIFDIPEPFDLAMICPDVDEWCCHGSLDILNVQRCIKSTHYLLGDGLRAAQSRRTWVEETDRKADPGSYKLAHAKNREKAKL